MTEPEIDGDRRARARSRLFRILIFVDALVVVPIIGVLVARFTNLDPKIVLAIVVVLAIGTIAGYKRIIAVLERRTDGEGS